MNYALAFASGFALDILYVTWVKGIADTQYLRPAVASMAIGLCGLVGLGQALHGGWSAVSYILGLGFGTVTGVWYVRRNG